MVVAHAVLEASRGSRGLDPSDDAPVGERRQGVVHGLERDCSDLLTDGRVDVGGGAVRALGDGAQDGQALSRDLYAVQAKKSSLVDGSLHGAQALYRMLE